MSMDSSIPAVVRDCWCHGLRFHRILAWWCLRQRLHRAQHGRTRCSGPVPDAEALLSSVLPKSNGITKVKELQTLVSLMPEPSSLPRHPLTCTAGDKTLLLLPSFNSTDKTASLSVRVPTSDLVQPFQVHSRTPDTGINVYSFALRPEEHQPSGTCNFSRIDNATLQLVLSNATVEGTRTAKVRVYATNYNVLRIMSGMGGLAYSN